MPIRPEMKHLYPKDWPAIRARIRARAGDRCEGCGVKNHAFRNNTTEEVSITAGRIEGWRLDGDKVARIVCTVAHLDHNPENSVDENLRFYCQRCHNRHDVKARRSGIRARREKGQELFAFASPA